VDGVTASLSVWKAALGTIANGLYITQALGFLKSVGVCQPYLTPAGNVPEWRKFQDAVVVVSKYVVLEVEAELSRLQRAWVALKRAIVAITDARYDSCKFFVPCFCAQSFHALRTSNFCVGYLDELIEPVVLVMR